jgi:hypothetical protein
MNPQPRKKHLLDNCGNQGCGRFSSRAVAIVPSWLGFDVAEMLVSELQVPCPSKLSEEMVSN